MDGTPGQRLDALYVAVRDGAAVDGQAAFDVAMSELEYQPLHAEARELAEASVAGGDEVRLASAAAAFLDACGYEPGFEQAPERFARLVLALDAVRADMRATGLNGRSDWSGRTGARATRPSRRGRATRGGRAGFLRLRVRTISPRWSRWPLRDNRHDPSGNRFAVPGRAACVASRCPA